MAGGPIGPISAMPATEDAFPNIYVTAAAGRLWDSMGVVASLGTDTQWELEFPLPPVDPGGTLKLMFESRADVVADQSAFIHILWAALAAGESFDTKSLVDEHSGVGFEIEHTTADDDEPIVNKFTLDADGSITYGTDIKIRMNVLCDKTSWDLAVTWAFNCWLIWE